MGVACLALIDIAVEHEIFLLHEAAQLLVADRGCQGVQGGGREKGSKPTPRAYGPTTPVVHQCAEN